MKYGILFAISIVAFFVTAGSLADGNVNMVTITGVVVSIIGCTYCEYKLGWLKEAESK